MGGDVGYRRHGFGIIESGLYRYDQGIRQTGASAGTDYGEGLYIQYTTIFRGMQGKSEGMWDGGIE